MKVREAPKQALQRKLLDGLRYLVREVLRLNQPEASDGWLTHDVLWLVSKTACDRLRAHLLSQGIDTAVFDLLQEHGIVQATPDGKAIWRATVATESGWTHAFTFLRLAPALIWDAVERPPPFSGTVRIEVTTETNPGGVACDGAFPTSADRSAAARASERPQVKDSPDAVGGVLTLFDGTSKKPAKGSS